MKKKVIFLFIFLGILIGIIISISIFYVYNSYSKTIIREEDIEDFRLDIPSKCYTTLFPSKYFNKNEFPNANSHKQITINYKNNQELFTLLDAGTSMYPTLSGNDILIAIHPVTPEEIKIGDIIAIKISKYSPAPLHRVIDIIIENGETYYLTKGDNNVVRDKQRWVFDDISAKVVGVLY